MKTGWYNKGSAYQSKRHALSAKGIKTKAIQSDSIKVKPFKLHYSPEDFRLKKPEGNMYPIVSKDGRVEANLFWEPHNVEMRMIVWDKGNIVASHQVGYPFAYGGGDKKPDMATFKGSLSRILNRQEVKWLDRVPKD
jgi:hypothetical protein